MFDFAPNLLVQARKKVQQDHPDTLSTLGVRHPTNDVLDELRRKLRKHKQDETLHKLIRTLKSVEWYALAILLTKPGESDNISEAALTCLEADPSRLQADSLWLAFAQHFNVEQQDTDRLDRLADLIAEQSPPAPYSWQDTLLNAGGASIYQRALRLLDWQVSAGKNVQDLLNDHPAINTTALVYTIHFTALISGDLKHWQHINDQEAYQAFGRMQQPHQLDALRNAVLNFTAPNASLYKREALNILTTILDKLERPTSLKEKFLSEDPDHEKWLKYWLQHRALKLVESYDDGHERAKFWRQQIDKMSELTLDTSNPEVPILIADFENFVIVDFCKHGNAAYLYKREDYESRRKIYNRTKQHDSLKDQERGERFIHSGSWQNSFKTAIDRALAQFGLPNTPNAQKFAALLERAKKRGELRPLDLPAPPPPLQHIPLIPAKPGDDDPSQTKVINSLPAARLLVEAPPGHGKTYTACERINSLIQQGVPKHKILVISFTRVAVRQLRHQLKQRGIEPGIDICTIDQLGATINQEQTGRSGDYDAAIQTAITMVEEGSEIIDRYQHILVDEAQDILGKRAALIATLLVNQPDDAGFTVFHDPAQAIYDWSYKPDPRDASAPPKHLTKHLEELEAEQSINLEKHTLNRLYRTSAPSLIKRMELSRPQTLAAHHTHAKALHQSLLENAPSFTPALLQQHLFQAPAEQTNLALFKSRVQVMRTSQALLRVGKAHNLRLGGFPKPIAPWIALLINQFGGDRINKVQAHDAWTKLGPHPFLAHLDFEEAWEALMELGGDETSIINTARVASRLGRSSIPNCVATSPAAQHKLTLSTIHSSKGMEAEHVYFAVPNRMPAERKRSAEFARELYVGLSRAKQELTLYKAGPTHSRANYGSRSWQGINSSSFGAIVGIEGDVELRAGLGVDQGQDAKIQAALSGWNGQPIKLEPVPINRETSVELKTTEGDTIGALSKQVPSSIKGIARKHFSKLGARQSAPVGELWWIDVITVSLPYKESTSNLQLPYQRTQVWLAPVIAGILEIQL